MSSIPISHLAVLSHFVLSTHSHTIDPHTRTFTNVPYSWPSSTATALSSGTTPLAASRPSSCRTASRGRNCVHVRVSRWASVSVWFEQKAFCGRTQKPRPLFPPILSTPTSMVTTALLTCGSTQPSALPSAPPRRTAHASPSYRPQQKAPRPKACLRATRPTTHSARCWLVRRPLPPAAPSTAPSPAYLSVEAPVPVWWRWWGVGGEFE